MKKLLFAIVSIFVIMSCNKSDESIVVNNVLRINEAQYPPTLNPKHINDVVSSRIIMQVFEGLVKYDVKHMTVIPAIAKSWLVDSSETVYTFTLRKDAYFHDNNCFKEGKGRQIKAQDFVYTFEQLCSVSKGKENIKGMFDVILGAEEFYEKSKISTPDSSIKGIKVIDDFTLEIVLKRPFYLFLNNLANPITSVVPKEGVEMYGNENYIGSGAFYFAEKPIKNKNIVLHKNWNYKRKDFLGNQIPFVDSVIISFVPIKNEQITLLENHNLDVVLHLTTEEVNEFLGVHKKDFEANPPKYIMENANNVGNDIFNVKRSYVNDFYINEMGYADYSLVKIEKPQALKE